MEDAFIRAELFIKALQNCSPSTKTADIKAYVNAIEKELKFIKKDVSSKLAFFEQEIQNLNKPTSKSWANEQTSSTWGAPKKSPTKHGVPPPVEEQTEKS